MRSHRCLSDFSCVQAQFIGSSSQASFVASGNRTDISLDDPNFWQKWAKIAELDTEAKSEKVQH